MPLARAGSTLTWPGFPAAIYARVYVPGVTTTLGNDGEIVGDIGFGPVGSNPSDPSQTATWTWEPLTYNSTNCSGCGDNYEYEINPVVPSVAGTYAYAARFSTDGRASYSYCAGYAGTSPSAPYDATQANEMEVAGSGCQIAGVACGADSDCCGAASGSCANSVCSCPGAGASCVPANGCDQGEMGCVEDGGELCLDTGLPADGTPCGAGKECRGGACSAGVTIGWCNVQFPDSIPEQSAGVPLPRAGTVLTWPGFPAAIYARVYAAGVTNVPGNSAAIQGDIGFGPVGSDPTDPAQSSRWTWQALAYNSVNCSNCGSNYEYEINPQVPSAPGQYDYAARFSGDGRQSYAYCAGYAGTVAGSTYDTSQAPVMTVAGSGCQSNSSTCGADTDCCSGSCANGQCVTPTCKSPGTSCSQNGQCCSGACGAYGCVCSEYGQACNSASDCCYPTDCVNGTCGCINSTYNFRNPLCETDEQCCSGSCQNSGECACVGHGVGTSCQTTADCCQGGASPINCVQGVCTLECTQLNGSCTADAQCCSNLCAGGKCGCSVAGQSCENNSCCNGLACTGWDSYYCYQP